MSFNINTLSTAQENQIFGRDIEVSSSDGYLDIEADSNGDIKLTDGLTELVANGAIFLLLTVYNYEEGKGELPFHPEFGSSFKYLIMNPIPDKDFVDIIQAETVTSLYKFFGDLITGIEFSESQFKSNGILYFNVYIQTTNGGKITMGLTV